MAGQNGTAAVAGTAGTEVGANDLLLIIGRQQVEIAVLRAQLAQAQQQLKAAEQEPKAWEAKHGAAPG